MKKLPVCESSNCELSVMLQPLSARQPAMAATMPRFDLQVTVRQYLSISILLVCQNKFVRRVS
ncbi:hypothetical protein NKH33_22370 [Mesorhizobium sp. M1182]|uniref:hypothetical protein n=1 Tax=Mesorhizobium sp. M1182 TaxID=2957067 RepID=UPI00333D9C1D